jgi:acetylglutamate kinase
MPIVIKYGGNAMTDPRVRAEVARAIGQAQAQHHPIVVHGGGPYIKTALEQAGITSTFVRGLRVTTAESLPIIESVLTRLGKELAQLIGDAVGVTGRDANLLVAQPLDTELGFVGQVTRVNSKLLRTLLDGGFTPVIGCLAENEAREGVLNVNADNVAGAVAGALGVPAVFLTDVPGVLEDPQDPASLLREVDTAGIRERIGNGRISGGMIPKVESALEALEHGAHYAVIADGRDAAGLRQALMGASGTRIYR